MCNKRKFAHEGAYLTGNACKIRGIGNICIGYARKALDKRAQNRFRGLDKEIYVFCRNTVLETDEGDLDDFVLVKLKAGCFQINRNKCRYLFHYDILNKSWQRRHIRQKLFDIVFTVRDTDRIVRGAPRSHGSIS